VSSAQPGAGDMCTGVPVHMIIDRWGLRGGDNPDLVVRMETRGSFSCSALFPRKSHRYCPCIFVLHSSNEKVAKSQL
jgi:hypothetical protein